MFSGKQIILGVSGGIAAYKSPELLRLLVKAGADIHVIMTRNAQEFITPLTFQTLSGNPVHTEMFNLIQEREIGHITLADRADLFVIAPATANIIGKIACGLADDLLTTTVMATKAPVLFVPAMNTNMWENPLFKGNQSRLAEHGYHFMMPDYGDLACGWQGKGKMPEPAEIFDFATSLIGPRDLAGKTVLVTAGPTREELDPIRFLTNHSSGRMGFAIARAARNRGAKVVLVSGPVSLSCPQAVNLVRVNSAQEMRQAAMEHATNADIVIKAAAVADFRPISRSPKKTKKLDNSKMVVQLERTIDILADLGAAKDGKILVGFAAETNNLLKHAREKLISKNLDMIVANDVTQPGAGFDVETNIVKLIFADGRHEELPQLSKSQIAEVIMEKIVELQKMRNDS